MGIASVLDRLIGAHRQREAHAISDYEAIVDRVAKGEEVDLNTLDRILHEVGKDVDQFRRDVEHKQQRLVWRAAVDRLDGVVKERQEIERRIRKATEALEKAEQQYRRLVEPLQQRLQELDVMTQEAIQARQRLLADPADPDLARQAEALGRRRFEAVRKRQGLLEKVGELRSAAAELRRDAAGALSDTDAHRLERQARDQERQIEQVEAEVAGIDNELANIDRDIERLRTAMLTP